MEEGGGDQKTERKELKERKQREKNRKKENREKEILRKKKQSAYGRHAPKWVNPLSPSIALSSKGNTKSIPGHIPFGAVLSKQLISPSEVTCVEGVVFPSVVEVLRQY